MNDRAQLSSLGKYDVRGTLGKGAMGVVYDGWDPIIHRRVAIKTLVLPDGDDPEAIEGLARFKREAQAAGRLTHPNIVGVFDYGETDKLAYIVMEFVEGRSLKEVLANNQRMSPETAVRLMEEILAGLEYSHECGVVHRDIKPANIMITQDGRTKIADFGIARIEASSMTQAGTVLGTPAYMSPEQFMGQVVDRRTDIYSSGVLLYQLLTGERPFDGSMTAIMHKVLSTVPPRPSELSVTAPPSLDSVVARAMARRPEDRFATAAAFAQALRQKLSEVDDPLAVDETIITPAKGARPATPAPTATAAAPPPGPRSKLPVFIGGGAGAVVVAAVAAWLLLGSGGKPANVPQAAAPSLQAKLTPASVPDASAAPPVSTPPPTAIARPEPTPVPQQQALLLAPPVGPPPVTVPPAVTPPAPSAAPAQPPVVPPGTNADPAPPPAVAPRNAAAIRAALADILPAAKCTFARATTAEDGSITVKGVAGSAAAETELRSAVDRVGAASVDWQVRGADGPFCATLDVLRPLATNHGASRAGLDIALATDQPVLADGDIIPLQVHFPDFPSFVHVAYVESGDSMADLLVPGDGYPARTAPYVAQSRDTFGKPHSPNFQGWQVGPPFGTDMVVAVASSAPLFKDTQPPQSVQNYVAVLQKAIADLRQHGGTASAAVILLDTKAAN
jgi:serine/threonine-protein kinase